MKLVVVNGGPRLDMNTMTLLQKTMEGARSKGATIEQINLYRYDFNGCKSCFSCKIAGAGSDRICVIKDDAKPLLQQCLSADALLFGSPIYYDNITGVMRAFLERLWYPIDSNKFDENRKGIRYITRTIPVGFIFSMNCPEDWRPRLYGHMFDSIQRRMEDFLGPYEAVYSCDTYQFKDYSKYNVNMFSEEAKAKHRDAQFPIDLENAYQLGVRLATFNKE